MGSDDIFKKRKARGNKALKRKKAKKAPYESVLVVCEGSKTEPNYFKEIRVEYRLNTYNVEVTGDCGSSPISVVNKAIDIFKNEPVFDRVYCVFDKDNHETYNAAKDKIKRGKLTKNDGGEVHFEAVTSIPCFEYWLLLHFTYTTKPYTQAMPKSRSVSDQVIDDLKKYLPDYKKNDKSCFQRTKENLPNAVSHSKSILAESIRLGEENPSTRIHILIEYLINLKA